MIRKKIFLKKIILILFFAVICVASSNTIYYTYAIDNSSIVLDLEGMSGAMPPTADSIRSKDYINKTYWVKNAIIFNNSYDINGKKIDTNLSNNFYQINFVGESLMHNRLTNSYNTYLLFKFNNSYENYYILSNSIYNAIQNQEIYTINPDIYNKPSVSTTPSAITTSSGISVTTDAEDDRNITSNDTNINQNTNPQYKYTDEQYKSYSKKNYWVQTRLLLSKLLDDYNNAVEDLHTSNYYVKVNILGFAKLDDGDGVNPYYVVKIDDKEYALFADYLLDLNKDLYQILPYDPKVKFKISDADWSKLTFGKYFLGMTKEEALMALGSPWNMMSTVSENKSIDVWRYGDPSKTGAVYLNFYNNKLISINKYGIK